jgi:tetratricopeptide (TPR) repeat protein
LYIFYSSCSLSQSVTPIRYSEGVCDCLDSLGKFGGVDENFPACYRQAIEKNASAVTQLLKEKYGDDTEKNITLLNDEIMIIMSLDLIESCSTYFAYTDSLQHQQYKNLNKDSLEVLIKRLNNYNATQRNTKYYQSLSTLYFQLGDYIKAMENVECTLSLDSQNASAMFIRASILEKKGNYSDAITLYDKVAALTKNKAFLIYSALAKRKKSGL